MSKRTCKDCRNRFSDEGTCPVRFGVSDTDDATNCDTFEPITVFHSITQSPEVLAHTYIYTVLSTDNEVFFCSALLSPTQIFVHLDEAIAATVEKLKEVCDE